MTCQAPGCRKSLQGRTPRARFCSDKCRTRAWKLQHDLPVGEGRTWAQNGRERGYGGLQLSWGPALEMATALVAQARQNQGIPPHILAERYMAHALPTRQRQRLEARQP